MSEVTASALIMVVSRPEAVEVAVDKVQPKRIGIIVSQDVVEPVVERCIGLRGRALFSYKIVDSPMEIEDSFDRFGHLLSDLEGEGYAYVSILLDATGGTTPMRLGAALAAITRGRQMVHQRVPQQFVNGRWDRDGSRKINVVPMHNSLESTGLLHEGQAVETFNRHDYCAAAPGRSGDVLVRGWAPVGTLNKAATSTVSAEASLQYGYECVAELQMARVPRPPRQRRGPRPQGLHGGPAKVWGVRDSCLVFLLSYGRGYEPRERGACRADQRHRE